jgi:hypothetical protein
VPMHSSSGPLVLHKAKFAAGRRGLLSNAITRECLGFRICYNGRLSKGARADTTCFRSSRVNGLGRMR